MAGEIHMLLGNRELAEPLLSRAAAELTEARYEAGAEKAALLLSPPDPSPAMRSGFGLGWLRAAILGAAGFFRDPRERARRWFAARTWYDIVPALLGTVIVGAILAGVLALVGLPLFWAVLAGVALMALSTFGQIVEPHDFLFKRLVVEMTGDEIEMVVYRHPGRSLLDTGRAGRYQRWRGWLHSYDEPDWAGTCGLEDGTLPDVFPDIRISEPSSTLETVVVLAEIPRDLQFLGPWEHTLGRCYPAKYAARLLWVRQLPGTRGRTSAVDWGRQGEAFHGPVRFRPARWAQVAEGPRRLLHVMGTPVRTVAGWQIRVRDATDASARETSRGAARRETLLDVHELTRDGVGLVVLQAEPVDDPPRPLGADHEGFVRTAMAAADNGANAVVVIPPLPDDLAKDAVETVWSAVTRTGAREVSAVVGLAADLKTMIAKAEQRAGDAVPASSDLLLFLRPVGTQEGPS